MVNTTHDTKPNAVLALAQYAYTRVAPLFAQAKTIDPSIQFKLELNFADEASIIYKDDHLHVSSHWSRDGMFQWSRSLRTMEDVDAYAAQLADDVATIQAPEAVTA
jgi:hypothetical protein